MPHAESSFFPNQQSPIKQARKKDRYEKLFPSSTSPHREGRAGRRPDRHHDHAWGANLTQEQFVEQRDKFVDRAASKLDLNATQKQLLSTLGDQLFAQRKALMGQSADPRSEIQSLIAGPRFDTAKAQALIMDKTTELQARSPQTLAALAAFYDSLNPAQQQQLRDLMDRHHGRPV